MSLEVKAKLDQNGFCIVPGVFSADEVAEFIGRLPILGKRAGTRSLLDHAVGQECAADKRVLDLVTTALGAPATPVRGILFDKTPDTNWTLGWHQDTKIAVHEKTELPGYLSWSIKEGVLHCRPPVQILENMVAVRIHLDDCGEHNGPLQAIPGSHLQGFCDLADETAAVKLTCHAGDVILMKPLTLHASSKSDNPMHRRVVHIEFCSASLDGGLRWATEAR